MSNSPVSLLPADMSAFQWNCLAQGESPLFEKYDAFEVYPCIDHADQGDDTPCLESCLPSEVDENGFVNGQKVVCWTVFGHLKSIGGIEDLHDCTSTKLALELSQWCETQLD